MAPPSCFAALVVPPSPAIAALHASLPPELRPIHPEDIHLTLAYFGRVDPSLHGPLRAAIGALPFDGGSIVLADLLPLPSRARPTSITLALEADGGRAAVVALMRAHRPGLLALAGRPPELREPLPHVTVARPRGRKMTAEKAAAILAWTDAQPPPRATIQLGRPVLMRSRPPRERGPHYEVVVPA